MGADSKPVQKKLDQNLGYIKEHLEPGEKNFDLILKEIVIGGKRAALLFVDGFTDSTTTTLILRELFKTRREEIVPETVDKMLLSVIPYVEVSTVETLENVVAEVLSGQMALMIDGEDRAVVIDTRQYPGRSPEEPDIEKITRGSRDGFVETLIFNVSLIRRRIRDPQLRVEVQRVGQRSSSDIAIMYIKDVAHPDVVERIRSRLSHIKIDALPMAEKAVEEFVSRSFWNPFPEVRYTERPDVAAVHLLEGHVVILVDTSPSVMIAPVTFFHHLQHAEEFRNNPVIGTYIRWVRMLGILLSLILVPLWMLLVLEPQYLPGSLKFIGPKDEAAVPLFIQFLIAHFGLDLLRMASIHTPSPFATALGLVGGLLIGQIAVEVGFFVPEVLLYTGVVAMGVFSTPSWELSMANRVALILLIVLTGLFHLPGFLAGLGLILVRLFTTRSFGFPYMWPLLPFDPGALLSIFIRRPVPIHVFRPSYLRTIDKDRLRKGK